MQGRLGPSIALSERLGMRHRSRNTSLLDEHQHFPMAGHASFSVVDLHRMLIFRSAVFLPCVIKHKYLVRSSTIL